MRKIKLGDLIKSIKFGKRSASDKTETGSFPFVTIEKDSKFFSETYDFDSDRVILQVSRHSKEVLPVVKFQLGKFGLSQNMIAILFDEKMCDQKFMYFLISEMIDEISENCFLNGTNLNPEKFKNIQIDKIPSISEQKNILKTLNLIQESKELIFDGLSKLNELYEASTYNLFDFSSKESILLSNILEGSDSKKSLDTSKLPVHSIQKNDIFSIDKKTKSKKAKKYKVARKNDIMYRPAGILESYINIVSNDSLIPTIYNLLRIKDSNVDINFLIYYLRSQNFLKIISSKVSSGVRTNISNKSLLNLKVPKFPSMEDQRKMVVFLNDIAAYKNSLEKKNKYYNELLKSIINQIVYT